MKRGIDSTHQKLASMKVPPKRKGNFAIADFSGLRYAPQ